MLEKERESKAWMATAVPTKGAPGRFRIEQCFDFIRDLVDAQNKISVKTDQTSQITYSLRTKSQSQLELELTLNTIIYLTVLILPDQMDQFLFQQILNIILMTIVYDFV